jgi:HlyD family secretion protein
MKTTTLIGVGMTCALLAACSNAEEVYTVQERLINEGVYASGEILPVEFDILKPTQPDRILPDARLQGRRALLP